MLAVSVSFWITGAACLWGCNNNALAAAERQQHQIQGTVTGRSCHSSQSTTHHCCSRKSANLASDSQPAQLGAAQLSTEALMTECPLSVIATAVVFEAKTHSVDATQASVLELPGADKDVHTGSFHFAPIQAFTRGPTYLRCCVFLI